MKTGFREILENCPVITAVKDDHGIELCKKAESEIVFILYGDICSIADIVDRIKAQGKLAIVHMDLVNGLSSKEIGVDFLQRDTRADGIISTRPPQIKRAKELELYTVHRFFAIDSRAYDNIKKQSAQTRPDCIEILPGCMPRVIRKIVDSVRVPVIAGGLISQKDEVMEALKAGAVSISTTDHGLWKI